jgi:hypothetical protein
MVQNMQINKHSTAYKRNKLQKSQDHLNRCKVFDKIQHHFYVKNKNPKESKNRRNIPQHNKGKI